MNIRFFNDLLSHRRSGATFNFCGDEVVPKRDVVTLACKTVSAELSAEELQDVAHAFLNDYLKDGTKAQLLYPGFFRLKNGDISIDVNVLVDAAYRENTLDFACANGQESIWAGGEERLIETGGSGVAKLNPHPQIVNSAAALLVRGFRNLIQST